MVFLLIATFAFSLLVSIVASASFARRLEIISDYLHFSPGLLSLLGALGANIPNYVASLTAAISGQVDVGIGIIIGSNIYNIAVILAIAAFASPDRHGLTISRQEAHDARLVGSFTLAILLTTTAATGFFSRKASLLLSHQNTFFVGGALLALNLLTLGLFCALSIHALHRLPASDVPVEQTVRHQSKDAGESAEGGSERAKWWLLQTLGQIICALAIALIGVIVMVQTGEAIASDIHLSPTILSLVILAVATSLPNTIMAFILALTNRASASVEELFSSNSVNAALGIALPLLFWSGPQNNHLLVMLDGPLMVVLTCIALFCVFKQRVSHGIGVLLLMAYIGWIVLHLLF